MEQNMEQGRLQRKQVQDYDLDDTTVRDLSILVGVVATAFIAIGIMVYAFGENQSTPSTANNPSAPQVERMVKRPPAAPTTTGQGGAQ
jgi:hypothetical protein